MGSVRGLFSHLMAEMPRLLVKNVHYVSLWISGNNSPRIVCLHHYPPMGSARGLVSHLVAEMPRLLVKMHIMSPGGSLVTPGYLYR